MRQAKGVAAEASWLLDRVGVERGWRAVDVGCGPIGIMDLLCDRVGVAGQTVGVDNDAGMLAMAREVAAELNLTNLTLVEAEAADTGLEPETFDFAHARLLLVNVPDPGRVVTGLSALVRPGVRRPRGGRLGLVGLRASPPQPWDRLRDALCEFRARRGLDVHMGRRLPGLLRGAGLDGVGFRAVCPTYVHGDDDNHNHMLLVTFAKLHGAELVADGLVAADELAGLVNALEAHLADPADHHRLHPVVPGLGSAAVTEPYAYDHAWPKDRMRLAGLEYRPRSAPEAPEAPGRSPGKRCLEVGARRRSGGPLAARQQVGPSGLWWPPT